MPADIALAKIGTALTGEGVGMATLLHAKKTKHATTTGSADRPDVLKQRQAPFEHQPYSIQAAAA